MTAFTSHFKPEDSWHWQKLRNQNIGGILLFKNTGLVTYGLNNQTQSLIMFYTLETLQ
jgi:hypothetical protein